MKFSLTTPRAQALLILAAALVVSAFILLPRITHAGGSYQCGYMGSISGGNVYGGWIWGGEDPRCALNVSYPYTGDYGPGPGTYPPEVNYVSCTPIYIFGELFGYLCFVSTQFSDGCDINAGKDCSGTPNICNQASIGKVQCDGSCDAGAPPAPVDQCAADPGIQCSLSECSQVCSPLKDQNCTKSNACSSTSGTWDCTGTICSAPAPTPLPLNYGNSCQSAANVCGVRGSGNYDCSGSCNAAVPAINPTVTISAAPARVNSGGTTTLTINGSDLGGSASSCSVTGPGVNQNFNASGCLATKTITTPAITAQSTYTVTCGSAVAKVLVNVNPKFVPF